MRLNCISNHESREVFKLIGFGSNFINNMHTTTCTDRKNVTNFLYLVLHLARKVSCFFQLFSSVLVSVLRNNINVLLKSKSRNYVTWIANLTKLFLLVCLLFTPFQENIHSSIFTDVLCATKSTNNKTYLDIVAWVKRYKMLSNRLKNSNVKTIPVYY